MKKKDRISALQELLVANKLPPPIYTFQSCDTSFTCTVKAAGVVAIGVAATKKAAKHISANNALEKLKSVSENFQTISVKKSLLEAASKNHVGKLNELASTNKVPYPNYTLLTDSTSSQAMYKCSFQGNTTYGVGNNEKDAKQNSARKMLELMKTVKPVTVTEVNINTKIEVSYKNEIISLLATRLLNSIQCYDHLEVIPEIFPNKQNFQSVKPKLQKDVQRVPLNISSGTKVGASMSGKSPISVLQELMTAKGLPMPVYDVQSVDTFFKCTVRVANIMVTGVALTKKGAKQEGAKSALEKLEKCAATPRPIPVQKSSVSFKNYVGELNEFASKNKLPYPGYTLFTVPGSSGFMYCRCSFQGNEKIGVGSDEKKAKQESARKVLKL